MDQHTNLFSIGLECVCLDHKIENCRLHYGRFAVSPFLPGQAITIGTAIRRALLGDVKGTCITSAYVVKVNHEYCILEGVRESVHDILLNLKDIVLKSDICKPQQGIILFQGPGIVTTEHIQLPSAVKVVDKTQYIAKVETATQLEIHITIEKLRGWQVRKLDSVKEHIFPIDGVLKPVRNVNYSIYSLGEGQMLQELLLLELWTNGALTPQEALSEASRNLTILFQPFLNLHTINACKNLSNHALSSLASFEPNKNNFIIKTDINKKKYIDYSTASVQLSNLLQQEKIYHSALTTQIDTLNKQVLKVSIDQLQLSVRASNSLKKAGVYTVLQLLEYTQKDLLKLENLGKRSAEQIVKALQQHFNFDLPKTR